MKRALALAFLLVAGAARAQTAADIATARDLFREGMELRAHGDLQQALAKLAAAHALYHTPASALELGRAQIDTGKLAEGYETLLSIDRIPAAGESRRSKSARAEAKALADKVKERIPTLRIDVTAAGDGAVVTLDGEVVPPALFGIARKVDPGHHVVVAKRGDEERKVEVDVAERQAAVAAIEAPPVVLAALSGPIGVLKSAAPSNRFSVLYKFLPPEPSEKCTLHARGGVRMCALPCEQWIGEHSGDYLERAPTAGDPTRRRVEVPAVLPATIGSTVTARPHAGRGSPGVGVLGALLTTFGALGVLGGPITLLVGLADMSSTNNTGRDTAITGGVITGVSAAFLVTGILLASGNYAPHMDYAVGP
jgi:hypothetical protein